MMMNLMYYCIEKMTEEAIYSSEKTHLDPQLEDMCKQADEAKNWTIKIIKDTETVLTPNPGIETLCIVTSETFCDAND
jgi:hypothetical protein